MIKTYLLALLVFYVGFKSCRTEASNDNYIILYTKMIDPQLHYIPDDWLMRFLASTKSPKNYSRRRLQDIPKGRTTKFAKFNKIKLFQGNSSQFHDRF